MQMYVKRIIGTVVAAGALAVAPAVASAAPHTLAGAGGSASVTASAPGHDGDAVKPMFCSEGNPCVM